MEEKKTTNISFSTFLFIIALIIIAIMSIFIFKLNNEKNIETQESIDLQAQVNSLNRTISNLREKTNSVSTNDITTDNNKTSIAGEQMIFSKIGTIYISTNGDVYFDPNDSAELFNEKVDIFKYAKNLLGEPKKYDIKSNKFMEGHHTFNYKLDLTDVRSVEEFYFGNGGTNFSLLFIHNNGNISELSYSDDNLKQYKNISGYSNIVSMVVDQNEDGNGARLYDKFGNGIDYTSPRFINN